MNFWGDDFSENSLNHDNDFPILEVYFNSDCSKVAVVSMESFRDLQRKYGRSYGCERLLEAFDLAVVQPPSIPSHFKLPQFHNPKPRRKRLSIIRESLSAAKLANLSERVETLCTKKKRKN